jgi:hypothetical protein
MSTKNERKDVSLPLSINREIIKSQLFRYDFSWKPNKRSINVNSDITTQVYISFTIRRTLLHYCLKILT